jgi:hypothetical protein
MQLLRILVAGQEYSNHLNHLGQALPVARRNRVVS